MKKALQIYVLHFVNDFSVAYYKLLDKEESGFY